jgi:F-type H+-transporting ATPase subunit a
MDFSHILNSKKITIGVVLGIFLMLFTFNAFAVQEQKTPETAVEAKETDKFDPTETIMEHIADSHYFHVGGGIAFPLPVILYTNKGLEIFCSSVFEEGKVVHQGKYYKYALIGDKIKAVDGDDRKIDETAKVFDFSITKNVASLWMSVILLLIIFISIASSYKKRQGKAPKGLQSFLEPVVLFVRDDIALPNIGYKYTRFMPLLLTVFFFILINNLIGLIPFFPGGSNLTGNIAVTFVLSLITLLVVNLNGNKYYWKHIFIPSDVPVWLWPLWWVVELLGIFSKPFALMIRLFANITAGHIIVLSLISLIFVFKSVAIAPVSIAFVVFMDVLELLVALLQAFIFTLLTALFIGSAIEEHHH